MRYRPVTIWISEDGIDKLRSWEADFAKSENRAGRPMSVIISNLAEMGYEAQTGGTIILHSTAGRGGKRPGAGRKPTK